MSPYRKSALAAVTAAFVLLSGGQAFADPPAGGSTTTTTVATATLPAQTPDGQDLIAKPADTTGPASLLPKLPAVPVATTVEARFRAAARRAKLRRDQVHRLVRLAVAYRNSAQRWAAIRGDHVRPVRQRTLATLGLAAVRAHVYQWKRVDNQQRVITQNPPHKRALECIHHFEGSWTDPNPPYWGGLQMDLSFMASYGGWLLRTKGTADHWTPLEQIWVAERAIPSRGFWPWPNTARYCGIL